MTDEQPQDGVDVEKDQEISGRAQVSELVRRAWSREFQELAGSAADFPYPDDSAPEAGPTLTQELAAPIPIGAANDGKVSDQ